MIIVNRFIINMSGLELCPCSNFENPSLPCTPYMQENWDIIVNNIYSRLSNPIVLEYGAFSLYNYDQISEYPYFCINGGDQMFPLNEPFPVVSPMLPIIAADAYPCYGPEFFRGDCVTSETETSITVRNSMTLEECVSYGPFFPQGYGGSVTITWE
jgi:hypothetical protein